MRQKTEHRPINHDKKHRLLATHHRASGEARRRYDVLLVTAPRWKTTFGGSLGENGVTIGGARFGEKSTTGSNQTGSWWCKQVKVLIRPRSAERKAVPQGLCGNLINALKNNIVTNLCEGEHEVPHEGTERIHKD